jgi:hypothetical protein
MTDITSNKDLDNLFSELQQTTQERETVNTPPPPPAPEIENKEQPKQENKPKIDADLVEASADILINVFDTIQANTFRFIWNKKRKTRANEITENNNGSLELKNAINKAKANSNKGAVVLDVLNNNEAQLLNLNEEIESYINDLGLTEPERKNISVPLRIIIEKNGGVIPVEIALMLGIATAVSSRVGELYTM